MLYPKLLFIGNFLSSQVGTRSIGEELAVHLQGAGCHVNLTSSKLNKATRFFDMVSTILKHCKNYNAAYIEVYSGQAFIWAEVSAWLVKQLRKPYILALHGGGLAEFARKRYTRVHALLKSASVIVTPSRFLQTQLTPKFGIIRYLPNALEIGSYDFRQREKVQPKFIWLRAFHDIYNPELAVLTMREVARQFPESFLTMIGPDKHDGSFERVKRIVSESNLQNNIHFTGPINKQHVPTELNKGDIFINTTTLESFGVAVMEAAACGLCIVTTNVGELPFLWEDSVDALLVPPNDPKAMAAAIRRILTEPGLAGRLSLNARKKAEQFDWSVIMPQWEKLIQSI